MLLDLSVLPMDALVLVKLLLATPLLRGITFINRTPYRQILNGTLKYKLNGRYCVEHLLTLILSYLNALLNIECT